MSLVLLVSDLCEDTFVFGECTRLSPEAPTPVFVPKRTQSNPGMGGNVLANLLSLSPDIQIETMFPKKASAKVRYVDERFNHHLLRIDNDYISEPLSVDRFQRAVDTSKFDAVIFSDYAKGWLNKDNLDLFSSICRTRNIPTFLDTKLVLGEWSRNITYVKINQKEFDFQLHSGVIDPWAKCQNLIVTRGKNGSVLYSNDGSQSFCTQGNEVQVYDVSGAGDTVLAALVVKFLETKNIQLSMEWANKAAQIAVSKRGVVAVERGEVDDKNIKVVFIAGCFDALHEGHLNLLRRARALGDRLVVGINDDDYLRKKGTGRPIDVAEVRVKKLYDTGLVTLVKVFSGSPLELIKKIKPAFIVTDDSYIDTHIVGEKEAKEWGGKAINFPRTEGISTTDIISKKGVFPVNYQHTNKNG